MRKVNTLVKMFGTKAAELIEIYLDLKQINDVHHKVKG